MNGSSVTKCSDVRFPVMDPVGTSYLSRHLEHEPDWTQIFRGWSLAEREESVAVSSPVESHACGSGLQPRGERERERESQLTSLHRPITEKHVHLDVALRFLIGQLSFWFESVINTTSGKVFPPLFPNKLRANRVLLRANGVTHCSDVTHTHTHRLVCVSSRSGPDVLVLISLLWRLSVLNT